METEPVKYMVTPNIRKKPPLADGLERAFLSEMLKYAGPKASTGQFSGGIGESQFTSMLTETYATAISERIELGLGAKFTE